MTDLSVVSDTLGTPIDGILGCPLFEGSLLEIDFPSKEVRVSVGTLAGERGDDQFKVSGDQRPYVPANFV